MDVIGFYESLIWPQILTLVWRIAAGVLKMIEGSGRSVKGTAKVATWIVGMLKLKEGR